MSSFESSSKPRMGTWALALLILLGYVAVLIAFPPRFEPVEGETSSLLLFVGRFHPVFLHLPVGALALLCVLELGCLTRSGEEKFGGVALFILLTGSAGAVMAVLAGILLSREGGYTGGNFSLHQALALIGTAGVLLALVVRMLGMGQEERGLLHFYRVLFFASFGLMGLGAHFGGNMSHGSKYLTEHAPEPLKSQMIAMEKWMLGFVEKPKPDPAAPEEPPEGGATPLASAAEEKLVFQDVLMPIFEAKCNNCHNEDKSKGGLRMDTFALLLQGGDSGAGLVPGKPEESLALERILLPEDDDEHMPPEGKEQMTADEVALFRWWIEQGASESLKVVDAKLPENLRTAAEAVMKGQPAS